MADKGEGYNDRQVGAGELSDAVPKPQLRIIVDGNSVYKPGMKTFFVDDYEEGDTSFKGTISGSYCTCNTVVVSSSAGAICTCDTVATKKNTCSCNGYSSSSSSSGGTRSCGGPCACVPVH